MQPRIFTGNQLVLATRNPGKAREIEALLKPYRASISVLTLDQLGIDSPAETGTNYAENALIKARNAATKSGLPALADDSGLGLTGLNGWPGVITADVCREAGSDQAGNELMLTRLLQQESRHAIASCVFALAWPDDHAELFVGEVAGTVPLQPRGGYGFGWDAIFQPDGSDRTFAEMRAEEKNAISPRRIALEKLIAGSFSSLDK